MVVMYCSFMRYQPCCCVKDNCCAKLHELRRQIFAVNVKNPAATLVLGLQLCIAEADIPVAGTLVAGNPSVGVERDDSEEYDLTTYEHRRSIEADYHPIYCLAQQPQVFIS